MKNILIVLLSLLTITSARAANWQLVWSDEFNYTGLPNSSKWAYEVGYVRNQEAQYYTNARLENARVDSGKLIIEARRDNWSGHPYTSASVTTKNKVNWKYGRFEMRARFDTLMGLWPAFWTLGVANGWPSCGEVDIMEYYKSTMLANAFWAGPNGTTGTSRTLPLALFTRRDPNWLANFHVWRMDWTDSMMVFTIDSLPVNSFSIANIVNNGTTFNPFHQAHYIIINLAIGGTMGGDPANTPFPVRYEVDYVRIYQDQPVGVRDDRHSTGATAIAGLRVNTRPGAVQFDLQALTADQPAGIIVCDVTGKTIRNIVISAGTDHYVWDGRDGQGMKVKPGVYFYTLQTANAQASGSVVMLN